MKTRLFERAISLVCAAVVTLGMLGGIDTSPASRT